MRKIWFSRTMDTGLILWEQVDKAWSNLFWGQRYLLTHAIYRGPFAIKYSEVLNNNHCSNFLIWSNPICWVGLKLVHNSYQLCFIKSSIFYQSQMFKILVRANFRAMLGEEFHQREQNSLVMQGIMRTHRYRMNILKLMLGLTNLTHVVR